MKFYFVSFIVMMIEVCVGPGAYYQSRSSIMVVMRSNRLSLNNRSAWSNQKNRCYSL
jgi:hypothetical protein